MITFKEYYDIVLSVQESSFKLVSPMIMYAQFIGAFGAIFSILKSYSKISRGKNGFEEILHFKNVILVALALMFYPSIMSGINGLFSMLDKDLENIASGRMQCYIVKDDKAEINARLKKRGIITSKDNQADITISEPNFTAKQNFSEYLKLHPELATKKYRNNSSDGKISGTTISTEIINTSNTEATSEFVENSMSKFISYFSRIALGVLMLTRTFILTVLYLLGPFAIGFFLIPGFEGSLAFWLQKYINVSLWIIVGFILELVLHNINKVETIASNNGNHLLSDISGTIGLISLLGYIMVPTIATWLVQGVSTNIAGKVLSAASKIAKMATSGGSSKLANMGGHMVSSATNGANSAGGGEDGAGGGEEVR